MTKPGDEVVLLYAVINKNEWDKVKLPDGCHAKAFEVGRIDDLIESQVCRGWGAMCAASMNRLAKKICPTNILHIGN